MPKSLAQDAVAALLAAIEHDEGSARSSDWAERDRALVLTALLAGLRSGELVHAAADRRSETPLIWTARSC
ncbi:hypothetical protein [Mycobacterium sp.]|uniref:hypothetical protein n=1 Tax=Mycobacterium sp. TaxID=1785 RepID=UPI003F98B517